MLVLKKLICAPFFLLFFILLILQLTPFLSSYDFLFSLSAATLIQLAVCAALITLSSFLFVLFVTLAQDWKLIVPVMITSSILPGIFIPQAIAIILCVVVLVSLLLICLSLDNTLKKYLDFQPSTLFSPAITQLSRLLILSFCLVYFLSTSKIISQAGFEVPDALIDTALKMSPASIPAADSPASQLPAINPQQLELLKENPGILKQYNLNPEMLESLTQPQNLTQTPLRIDHEAVKQTVKNQLQTFIQPYLNFIPIILASALFLTLKSMTSLINLLISPLLWIIFFILEKIGYIKFDEEQRTVRKMIV